MKKTIRILAVALVYVFCAIVVPIGLLIWSIYTYIDEYRYHTFSDLLESIGFTYHYFMEGAKVGHAANLYWIKTGDHEGAYNMIMSIKDDES